MNNPRGFLLLELLVASAVLTFGLVLIVGSIRSSFQAIFIAKKTTQAVMVAEEALSRWNVETQASDWLKTGEMEIGHQTYYWQAQAEPLPGSGLRKLSVAVRWGHGMNEREFNLSRWIPSS